LKKVHVVPHTHWDREWYFTLEDSNILLGDNLMKIIQTFEENPEWGTYTLDAQGSLLDEFAKIHPEMIEKVKSLIKDKKLIVGPWYTQSDTLLVNKEALIRNIFYGIKTCESYGNVMPIGYLPDAFGQNRYLPSLFKGFELDYAIFQRGIYDDELKENLSFTWNSPDGVKIETNNLLFGYVPGDNLSSEEVYIHEKLLPTLAEMERFSKDTKHLLLPTGGDQSSINPLLPQVIKELNEKVEDYEFVMSSYEEFMKETAAEEVFSKNSIEGEFRGTQRGRIHRTIGSMRYDIKVLNSKLENKILNVLEPLATIFYQFDKTYPHSHLEQVWKEFFDVHAHDSMGGCNSDETNQSILDRLHRLTRTVDSLINLIKKKITLGISQTIGKDNLIVAFNTNVKENKTTKNVVVFTNSEVLTLSDLEGKDIPFSTLSRESVEGGTKMERIDGKDVEVPIPSYFKTTIEILDSVEALGFKTYLFEEGEGQYSEEECTVISNEFTKIWVEDGKVSVASKHFQTDNFFYFEDCGDDGDSYDFSPLREDKAILIGKAQFVGASKAADISTLTVSHKAQLPVNLKARVSRNEEEVFEIETTLTLEHGRDVVGFHHVIHNNISDHKVRIVFDPKLEKMQESWSDSGYSLISHPVIENRLEIWEQENYAESPVPIYNMENLIVLKDTRKQWTVAVEGLKEYEIVDNKLALTLFRSVGVLGKGNLAWRPGRASGIMNKVVETPFAQLQKTLTFDYVMKWGELEEVSETYAFLEEVLAKSCAYQKQNLNTYEERLERFGILIPAYSLPTTYSLFEIDNDRIFLSMLKKAEDDEGVVLRLYNPSDKEETVQIKSEMSLKITEVNLLEKEGKSKEVIQVPAFGYVTVKIKQRSDNV